MTGHIAHHAAHSLMFPLPVAGSQPQRQPVPWDPAQPYRGLGWRSVSLGPDATDLAVVEKPILATAPERA